MGKYYSIPENKKFIEKAKELFSSYLEKHGYSIISTRDDQYICEITYLSENRKVEIKNQYNYTDYGFSIFIFDIVTQKANILANVPFGEEDKNCVFMELAATALLGDPMIDAMFSGQNWEDLKGIFYWIKEDY